MEISYEQYAGLVSDTPSTKNFNQDAITLLKTLQEKN